MAFSIRNGRSRLRPWFTTPGSIYLESATMNTKQGNNRGNFGIGLALGNLQRVAVHVHGGLELGVPKQLLLHPTGPSIVQSGTIECGRMVCYPTRPSGRSRVPGD